MVDDPGAWEQLIPCGVEADTVLHDSLVTACPVNVLQRPQTLSSTLFIKNKTTS